MTPGARWALVVGIIMCSLFLVAAWNPSLLPYVSVLYTLVVLALLPKPRKRTVERDTNLPNRLPAWTHIPAAGSPHPVAVYIRFFDGSVTSELPVQETRALLARADQQLAAVPEPIPLLYVVRPTSGRGYVVDWAATADVRSGRRTNPDGVV